MLIDWTSTTWNSIDMDIIVRSFLCCGIYNVVNGSDDDQVQDRIPRDIDVDDSLNNEDPIAKIDELDFVG